jgi:thioredoxin reductase
MDVHLVTGHMGGKSTAGLTLPDMSDYHVLKSREQVQVFRGQVEYLSHLWRRGHVHQVKEDQTGFTVAVTSRTGTDDQITAPPTVPLDGSPDRPDGSIEELKAERLIIATGTTPRPLGVPGEAAFFGRGLGSSAISYSHLLRERSAVIIGDSDRAVESALECALQAQEVSLILEPNARYSHGHLELVERQDNITVYNGYRAVDFQGDEFARTVEICRGQEDCSQDRPHRRISADAFFVEREPQPNSSVVKHLVHRSSRGAIQIDEQNRTSNPRIFAAGDVTTVGVEQILVALGEGARAGLSAYRQLTLQA